MDEKAANMEKEPTNVEELATLLRAKDPAQAVLLERYIAETKHLKDIAEAVIEDIGYSMKELDLCAPESDGLRRCTQDLAKHIEEHTRATESQHERLFRPRFTCTIKSFRHLGVKSGEAKGEGGQTGSEANEAKMELVLQFPAREYNESPHSLIPGKAQVYIMMKGI
ncbi:hypothetical protein NM208_g12876 [Fusarium decemcellulare]|uniref:Uncharacterized protein n=1 Tax=Fusarium decemcellulare TaxID=57161 RepID=A0ACC1RMD2_9HYPO|nr:hypothetical protein NM208_g12876 [Fusarium decemcellulare]